MSLFLNKLLKKSKVKKKLLHPYPPKLINHKRKPLKFHLKTRQTRHLTKIQLIPNLNLKIQLKLKPHPKMNHPKHPQLTNPLQILQQYLLFSNQKLPVSRLVTLNNALKVKTVVPSAVPTDNVCLLTSVPLCKMQSKLPKISRKSLERF